MKNRGRLNSRFRPNSLNKAKVVGANKLELFYYSGLYLHFVKPLLLIFNKIDE